MYGENDSALFIYSHHISVSRDSNSIRRPRACFPRALFFFVFIMPTPSGKWDKQNHISVMPSTSRSTARCVSCILMRQHLLLLWPWGEELKVNHKREIVAGGEPSVNTQVPWITNEGGPRQSQGKKRGQSLLFLELVIKSDNLKSEQLFGRSDYGM